jgi:hypothetical protein
MWKWNETFAGDQPRFLPATCARQRLLGPDGSAWAAEERISLTWDIITNAPQSARGDVLHPGFPLEPQRYVPFEPEPGDYVAEAKAFGTTGVTVRAKGIKVVEIKKASVEVYLTTARLVLLCRDSPHLHGRSGFAALGHVRWPWLAVVGSRPASGGLRRRPEELQLRLTDATDQAETKKIRYLSLTFSGPTEPADQLATEIYERTIRYRLSHEPGAVAEGWEELLTSPKRQEKDGFSHLLVPKYVYARETMPEPYAIEA